MGSRSAAHPLGVANPYSENAFRVLALSTRATDIEVRRRAKELTLQAELDGDPETIALLKSAHARLEDPTARLEEELFWFALTPDPVPEDLDPSADGERLETVLTHLAAMRDAGSDEAAHDLAVLRHIAAIETCDDGQDQWRPALESWENLWSDDRFWMRMRLRAAELGDARASDALVNKLRKNLPERILDTTAAEIAELLEADDDDSEAEAEEALTALRASTFPSAVVAKARAAAVEKLSGRVKDLLGESRAEFDQVEAGRLTEVIRQRWAALHDGLVAQARRLKELAADSPQVESIVDGVSTFLRQLGIRLYNESDDFAAAIPLQEASMELAISDIGISQASSALAILRCRQATHQATQEAEAGRWAKAIELLTEARRVAPNANETTQIDQLLRVCRFRLHSDQAIALGQEGRWAEAAAAATQAASLAGDEEQRSQLRTMAANFQQAAARGVPSPRAAAAAAAKRKRNGWIAAAVVIGGLILWGVIASAGSTSSLGTNGTNGSGAGTTSQCSANKQALGTQIDNLKATMDQINSQLTTLRGQINQYGGPNRAPQSLINQYNALVDQYNSDLAAYNSEVQQYNGMSC